MKLLVALTTAVLLLGSTGVAAEAETITYKGVTFGTHWAQAGIKLALRGVGCSYYMMLWRVTTSALYLEANVPSERVLDDVPKRLEIHYFYRITPAQFAKLTVRGIEKNVPADEFAQLRPRVMQFNALYREVEKGDRYALTYIPHMGTELALNDNVVGIVEGADFARALFSIWLGDEPLQGKLKRRLLDQ